MNYQLQGQNIWGPLRPTWGGNVQTVEGQAYALCLEPIRYSGWPMNFITVRTVSTNGATGSQASEVALATSPLYPNGAGQTLTIVAAQTLGAITGTNAAVRNAVSLAYVPVPGTVLWMVYRCDMSGGGKVQPTIDGISRDYSEGHMLISAGAAALAVNNTLVCTIPAITPILQFPFMRVSTV